MNCEDFLSLIGCSFKTAGENSIKVSIPATLCNDGQNLSFYIIDTTDGNYHITDAGETALHAAQFGIQITKNRLESLNKTTGINFAKFEEDGAISSFADKENVQVAIWDVIKLSLAISFNSNKWLPKFDQIKFRALVEQLLVDTLGNDKVLRSTKARGISGHTIEFPLAIKTTKNSICLVEPIALTDHRIDWPHVYQTHGRLSDIKQADEENDRLIIFENGADDVEFGRAATLLSQTAKICTFSQARSVISAI